MASYLLSVTSHTVVDATPPSPKGYFVEWAQKERSSNDGFDQWTIDLQLAGAVADWAKGVAYDAFWSYLEAALSSLPARPRGILTVKSRVDPHRVAATFAYLGPQQVLRARSDLRTRIAAGIDERTGRLKADVDLRAHD